MNSHEAKMKKNKYKSTFSSKKQEGNKRKEEGKKAYFVVKNRNENWEHGQKLEENSTPVKYKEVKREKKLSLPKIMIVAVKGLL